MPHCSTERPARRWTPTGRASRGSRSTRAFFNDVRTDGRGVTRVILRYEVGTNDTSKAPFLEDYDGDATTGLFEMKARSVSGRRRRQSQSRAVVEAVR